MEEIYSKMFHAQYNQQGALLGTRFISRIVDTVQLGRSNDANY